MKNTEISLSFRTRGNSSPRGKARVYLSYHPKDIIYLDHTIKLILYKQDCAVYYYDYANGEPDETALGQLFGEMQLFVIPVTSSFLAGNNNAFDFEFQYAMEHHIPVLPLLQNSGLAEQFNRKCGNLQFLDEYAEDKTAISFDEKLEKRLRMVLFDDELTKKIQAAFDAHVFLSYRKMDREHAQKLMQLIHKNELCRDIAIWYDEFLVAGEPFDKAIEKALNDCDLFTLLVTPNVLEKNDNGEDNYVMSMEYPAAKEAKKDILPAESIKTNREELEGKFDGIPECVDANDGVRLPSEVLEKLKDIAIAENNTPEHNFLIGLAYLNGIDVEKKHELAFKLIEGAHNAGLIEATKELAAMYTAGKAVAYDPYKAAECQMIVLQRVREADNSTLQNKRKLAYELVDLAEIFLMGRDDPREATPGRLVSYNGAIDLYVEAVALQKEICIELKDDYKELSLYCTYIETLCRLLRNRLADYMSKLEWGVRKKSVRQKYCQGINKILDYYNEYIATAKKLVKEVDDIENMRILRYANELLMQCTPRRNCFNLAFPNFDSILNDATETAKAVIDNENAEVSDYFNVVEIYYSGFAYYYWSREPILAMEWLQHCFRTLDYIKMLITDGSSGKNTVIYSQIAEHYRLKIETMIWNCLSIIGDIMKTKLYSGTYFAQKIYDEVLKRYGECDETTKWIVDIHAPLINKLLKTEDN